ncbi:uncharacterized protein LOC111200920 [Brassica napus]|uniref:uncharacterized protein LOC111200920 n=1 Tax=Brassica napus TaxID=3708 RepID=UPI00207AF6D4|nr:uncharacterized protein LOC111200920 [Brassica napus]
MAMVRASKNIVSYIRELKPRKDTSRIEVRIVRLWRNYNKESGNTIEMVFVDKEGTRIHASVGEQLIKKFDDKLREGDAIVVQLFKVYDAIGEYRTTPHPYKIGFFQTIFVGKADDFPSAVPKNYFADFSDILGGNLDPVCLPDDSLALTNNDSSQWSVGTATSIRARFFVLNEMLTIREIIDSTLVGTFVTLGTIETIDTERGWQYLSCKYQNKKVMPTTKVDDNDRPLFFCNTCDKEHSDVISSGEANFLLFDANAQQIVRHSAAELYDENEDEDFLPEAVSDLFGKRVLCEISVDAGNIKGKSSQYVVRLATDDREMVEEFADLPPKPVLMLESTDDISSGSGGFTATPLSKRKSEQDEDSCLEDQHSVNKKLSQKKFKGE